MTGPVLYFASGALGYMIGAISFAVLIAKSKGVDIFSAGSGNPGATNVLRTMGRPYGFACFFLDALKGVVAVLVGRGLADGGDPAQIASIIGLLGAIFGHSFSLFLRFRGGKGVATTVGGLFVLMPLVMLMGAFLWLIVFFATRYVSLASLVLGVSLPISALLMGLGRPLQWLCLILAILIVIRHRANIQRLLAGTENRAQGKKS